MHIHYFDRPKDEFRKNHKSFPQSLVGEAVLKYYSVV